MGQWALFTLFGVMCWCHLSEPCKAWMASGILASWLMAMSIGMAAMFTDAALGRPLSEPENAPKSMPAIKKAVFGIAICF